MPAFAVAVYRLSGCYSYFQSKSSRFVCLEYENHIDSLLTTKIIVYSTPVESVEYSEPLNRDAVVKSIVVVGISRTPFCKAGGRLATITAEELGAIAARDMLLKAELSPTEVDHVFVGSTEQHITGQDLASVLARRCGIPDRAATMNLSGKPVAGMQALMLARNAILQGQAHTVLVAGLGSTSNYPVEMPAEFNRNFNKRRRESGVSSAFA